MAPEPTWIKPAHAARILHVDASTLRKWYAGGRLDGVRVHTTAGGQRRYALQDIQAMCDQQLAPLPPSTVAQQHAQVVEIHESRTVLIAIGTGLTIMAAAALAGTVIIALLQAFGQGAVASADAQDVRTVYRVLYGCVGCTLPSGAAMLYFALRTPRKT